MKKEGEFIIGKVERQYKLYKPKKDNEYQIHVTHINPHNKFSYHDKEMIKIEGKVPKNLVGRNIKCYIKYRDEYNRILCTVVLIADILSDMLMETIEEESKLTPSIEWVDIKKKKPKTKDKWDTIPVLIATDDEQDKRIGFDVIGCFYSKKYGFRTDEGLEYNRIVYWSYMPKNPTTKFKSSK